MRVKSRSHRGRQCGGMRVVWLQEPRLQCGDRRQDSRRTTTGKTTGAQQQNRQRKYVRSSPARALDLYRIPNHCAQQEQGTQRNKAHNQNSGSKMMYIDVPRSRMMIPIWLQNSATTEALLEGAQALVQLILPHTSPHRNCVVPDASRTIAGPGR